MNAMNKKPVIHKDVTCPFCSLLCDDLVIENRDSLLKVKKNGCRKAIHHIEHAPTFTSPRIKGKNVTLDEAVDAAVKLLRKSSRPLITGMGTDINGARGAMLLAEKTGATIDHAHGEGAMCNIRVLQDNGWIMTTMAEIKNRADLVIFAGTDGITNYPRFAERALWSDGSMFNRKNKQREIVYIGDNLDTSAAKTKPVKKPDVIQCNQQQIIEIFSTLHAMVAGNSITHETIAGVRKNTLEKLAEKMKRASYGVIVWAPGELKFPHAELTIQSISECIKYLNRTTRFAGFSLGGNDGGISVMNVCAWQCGYPLRVTFSRGFPEYDPHKYSTRNSLRRKKVDILVWISSLSSDIKPPVAKIPSIILSSYDPGIHFRPDVLIPVGTPGIDHGGQMIRTDSVVSLPLKQLEKDGRPAVSEILDRINDAL